MRIARETWLLLTVGLVDLLSTIFLVRKGVVREANPMMAWYLIHFGELAFCIAKTAMLICPLIILEWARRVKPAHGTWALRAALMGYVLLYAGVVWRANQPHLQQVLSPHPNLRHRIAFQQKKLLSDSDLQGKPMVLPLERDDIRL